MCLCLPEDTIVHANPIRIRDPWGEGIAQKALPEVELEGVTRWNVQLNPLSWILQFQTDIQVCMC